VTAKLWARIASVVGEPSVDKDKKTSGPFHSPMDAPVQGAEIEELYRRLQPAARRGKSPSSEPVAAAMDAVQQLTTAMDAENAVNDMAKDLVVDSATVACAACGYRNRRGNRFCGKCGGALSDASPAAITPNPQNLAQFPDPFAELQGNPPLNSSGANESHHYHHHYHHHYFNGTPEGNYPRAASEPVREDKLRPNPAMRGDMSRAEAAVRRVTQEWVLACNTRHLDDLLELYASDAMVLRSNYPPIRGAAAIREFFFGALDAGLGEVEVEPLRVDIVGDLAYEAGRCKALIPSSTGKRREERGKYLWVFTRQPNTEWKLAADCWSSDLTLSMLESEIPANAAVKTAQPRKP
jgi:ketosteroid isomerase-like protein